MADKLAPYAIPCLEGLELSEDVGRGSFGVVYEVTVNGLPCIAKRLHSVLVSKRRVSPQERDAIAAKFRDECLLLSRLRHPNIVQFLGVHSGRDRYDLTLVMERMHMDLEVALDKFPNIPLPFKIGILLDVSYGLLYLHSQSPPIIHRDVKVDNILLSPDFRAKVADLGVSKILDLSPQQFSKQTQCPGALAYMSPEALRPNPVYGVKLDVFSFGHVALYTANQSFPESHELGERYTAAYNSGTVQLTKRKTAINKMGTDHCLYQLIVACLRDSSEQRPTTAQVTSHLQKLSVQNPQEYSPALARLAELQRQSSVSQLQDTIQIQAKEIEALKKENGERAERITALSNVVQLNQKMAQRGIRGQEVDEYLDSVSRLVKQLSEKDEQLCQQGRKLTEADDDLAQTKKSLGTAQHHLMETEREKESVEQSLLELESRVRSSSEERSVSAGVDPRAGPSHDQAGPSQSQARDSRGAVEGVSGEGVEGGGEEGGGGEEAQLQLVLALSKVEAQDRLLEELRSKLGTTEELVLKYERARSSSSHHDDDVAQLNRQLKELQAKLTVAEEMVLSYQRTQSSSRDHGEDVAQLKSKEMDRAHMAKQMEKFEKVSSSWSKLGVESRELSERVTRLEGQLEGSEAEKQQLTSKLASLRKDFSRVHGDSAAKEIQLKKMQEDKLHVTVELQGEVRRWRGQAERLEQKELQLEADCIQFKLDLEQANATATRMLSDNEALKKTKLQLLEDLELEKLKASLYEMDFQQERTDREIMSTRVNAVEEEYKKKLKLAEMELLHLKSMGMADTAGRPRSARRREEKPPVMLPNPFSHALSGSYSPPTPYTSSQVGAFSAPGEREKREREERERDRAEYKHTKSSSDSTPSTPSTSVTSSVATMTQRLGELQEQSSVIELQNTIQHLQQQLSEAEFSKEQIRQAMTRKHTEEMEQLKRELNHHFSSEKDDMEQALRRELSQKRIDFYETALKESEAKLEQTVHKNREDVARQLRVLGNTNRLTVTNVLRIIT